MKEYEKNRQIVRAALEEYRDAPSDGARRRFVDWLMKKSLQAVPHDPEGKKYHNLIALRYISSKKRAKKPICDALHISRECFEVVTNNAIDRLLVLAFGVNGIDWASLSSSPQGQSEASECLRLTTELARLKYETVAGFLMELGRNIRENPDFSEDERKIALDTVKTAQARLLLNAVFELQSIA